MTIHVIDSETEQPVGDVVIANCGKELEFTRPIRVMWDDSRICKKCLEVHHQSNLNSNTFAFFEKELVPMEA